MNQQLGTAPGTLMYVGPEIHHSTKLRRIEFNTDSIRVDTSGHIRACVLPDEQAPEVTWLDVDGIHEPQVIAGIGEQYHLHPLLLEDVLNTGQKPKLDEYDNSVLFLTVKMLHVRADGLEIEQEHVSFVLGPRYIISFQEERTEDIFTLVLTRLQASAGKTRRAGADYLLYSLLDLIVDNYFSILETVGATLDALEERIIDNTADRSSLTEIYTLRREMALMRRDIWPLRDMIGQLLRDESSLIDRQTLPYFRDLNDHITQVIETVDSNREVLASLLDVYLSAAGNRMNAVMKILTIFSAIFMPITFLAGVYGMNFDVMPELHTRTGYFWVLGAMAATVVGEIIYFKRRGWL